MNDSENITISDILQLIKFLTQARTPEHARYAAGVLLCLLVIYLKKDNSTKDDTQKKARSVTHI